MRFGKKTLKPELNLLSDCTGLPQAGATTVLYQLVNNILLFFPAGFTQVHPSVSCSGIYTQQEHIAPRPKNTEHSSMQTEGHRQIGRLWNLKGTLYL